MSEQQVQRRRAAAPSRSSRLTLRRPWRAVDRHSRRVALLKLLLPAVGLSLLLLVAAWPRLRPLLDSVRLAFPAIDLREARELKMVDPRYAGVDRRDRPFVVTAAIGRQVPSNKDLMALERPRAQMRLRPDDLVTISAASGVYQGRAQLLDLFKDVTITREDGTRFATTSAHVDFSQHTAEGNEPVAGHGPSGTIAAQGFRILSGGDTVIFTGRSHLVLKGARPSAAPPAPPPALPPAVKETAAALAAAARAPQFPAGKANAEARRHAR